jgi:hypothetical protein
MEHIYLTPEKLSDSYTGVTKLVNDDDLPIIQDKKVNKYVLIVEEENERRYRLLGCDSIDEVVLTIKDFMVNCFDGFISFQVEELNQEKVNFPKIYIDEDDEPF